MCSWAAGANCRPACRLCRSICRTRIRNAPTSIGNWSIKSPSEIKAYWSRLMFSGGARYPSAAGNAEEQMKLLSNTPGAIGYMERRGR